MAFFLPETKGLLIEDVHEVFASHWFWKRTGVVTHSKVTSFTVAPLTLYGSRMLTLAFRPPA